MEKIEKAIVAIISLFLLAVIAAALYIIFYNFSVQNRANYIIIAGGRTFYADQIVEEDPYNHEITILSVNHEAINIYNPTAKIIKPKGSE